MHERDKIQEARYFLTRMFTEHDYHVNFRFELSAFLGAARSVLQYALKEAERKPGGKQWYDQTVANNPLLKFFKNQRDTNIHAAPIQPARDMTMQVSEYLRLDEDIIIPFRHNTTAFRYYFADWPDEVEVIELCEQYLNSLQTFVEDGVALGMVTG